jgi:hypothetical protein
MSERDELADIFMDGIANEAGGLDIADAILAAGYRKLAKAPDLEAHKEYACAVEIWDGPYKMKCSYMIVNGRCVRHGAGKAVYEAAK